MKDNGKLYVAYGSNLNKAQMMYRCRDAVYVANGVLEGWRLVFQGQQGNGYCNIIRNSGHCVPVGIWRISVADEYSLDRYEGVPVFYTKGTVTVQMHRTVLNCMGYFMRERPYAHPDKRYLRTVRQGYQDCQLPMDYLEEACTFLNSSQARGKNLQYYRLRKGYTQAELERICGFSRGRISKYERGERDIEYASVETIRILVEALDLSSHEVSQIFLKK